MKENHVKIGGKQIEVKSPRVLYLRNRTGCFGPVLEAYPLPTILALDKEKDGTLKDGYLYLFHWVVAALDDFEFAKEHFWDIEVGTLSDMLDIYTERGLPPKLKEQWTPRKRKKRRKPIEKTIDTWKEIEEKIRKATSMDDVWNAMEGWTIGEVQEMIEETGWRGLSRTDITQMARRIREINTIE